MSQTTGTEKPGRYERSFNGMVGAMIVLVLVVLGIVVFRGAFRDTPEYEPDPIDYRALITSVQQAGMTPVYPPTLPEGWFAKAAGFDANVPSLDIAFTTADEHTAGIVQEDTSADSLVSEYVGDSASEDRDTTITTDLGGTPATWTLWNDTDGDHAWTTEVDDQTVLVYSSGDADDLRAFVESLTTAAITP